VPRTACAADLFSISNQARDDAAFSNAVWHEHYQPDEKIDAQRQCGAQCAIRLVLSPFWSKGGLPQGRINVPLLSKTGPHNRRALLPLLADVVDKVDDWAGSALIEAVVGPFACRFHWEATYS